MWFPVPVDLERNDEDQIVADAEPWNAHSVHHDCDLDIHSLGVG